MRFTVDDASVLLPGIALLGASALAALAALAALRTGRISASVQLRRMYDRSENPVVYWALLVVDILFAVAALVVGVGAVLLGIVE